MNKKGLIIKGALSVGVSLLTVYFDALKVPLICLGTAAVIDYITGIISAYMNCTLSSKIGLRGILKKLSYVAVIALGTLCDVLLSAKFDFSEDNAAVTVVIAVWLTVNEMISVLENLTEMNVPVPGFLIKIIKKLKISSEEKGERK